ncbi:hypothetical protein GCM10027288_53490 [Bordetella tumbae]
MSSNYKDLQWGNRAHAQDGVRVGDREAAAQSGLLDLLLRGLNLIQATQPGWVELDGLEVSKMTGATPSH